MANTYLTRTTGTPTLGTKFTVSTWVKISEIPAGGGGDRWIFGEYGDSNNHSYLYLRNSSAIGWYEKDGGSSVISRITNKICRDTNAWYHLMIAIDTTDSTAEDRFKLYINGERQTDWGTSSGTYSSSATPRLNSNNQPFSVGGTASYGSNFVGSMSHMHFCDGTALAPTVFGSTDSVTGEWFINTSPSFTVGNNGFTILKDGDTITDQSSNSNNFSLGGGTLTKTEDCPSNVFATWNVLDSHYFWGAEESSWCTNGNTTARSGNSQYSSCTATLGASKGKYYWEFKYVAKSGSQNLWHLGIKSTQDTTSTNALGEGATDYSYKAYNGQQMNNGSSSAYGSTYAVGDIIGIAMDLDNNKLYFHKNGTYLNSGVPTSGSTGTGAISIADASTTAFGFYVPAFSWNDGSSYGTNSVNFGNGYFGTTAVSSAGTNASGVGIFEYDVPAGYTALSTKGLNL